MHAILQDVRHSTRLLWRSPAFTAAALICLMLGIGATTAIFSVVNAVVLRPLPYQEPDRLFRVYTEFPTFPGGGLKKFWVSPPEFGQLSRDLKSFETVEAWALTGANVAGAGDPVRITTAQVTGGMLPMLGVSPARGRLLSPSDDREGAPLTAVISYGLWQRAFGGDPSAIGREVKYNGLGCTIVGVMPPSFQFPPGEVDPAEMWVPMQLGKALTDPTRRGNHFLSVVARTRPGVGLAAAATEVAQYVNAIGAQDGPRTHVFHPKNHPVLMFSFHDEVVGAVRPAMLMMLGAVGFVLLIACVNVANLLLARAESRQKEIAIRSAIGAGTSTLVRQFITEGVILSLTGAALGLALAYGGLRALLAAGATQAPRLAETTIDGRVLAFTLGISVLTGLFFGLAPIAQVLARSLSETLKASAGRTTATVEANRVRKAMVIAELSLALTLLIGAGLLTKAFWKLQATHVGFNPDKVVTLRIALPQAVYPETTVVTDFWTKLQDHVSSLPGVRSASMMSGLPPIRQVNANDTEIEGFVPKQDGPIQNVDYYQVVGKKWFETMSVPLVEGRYFDERDGADAPQTIIVNQTMARTFWPGQSPIGRRIRPMGPNIPWRTVIGVVGDLKNAGIDHPAGTEIFFPYQQTGGQGLRTAFLTVKTANDPNSLVSAIRSEVRRLDSTLPISSIRTMDEVVAAAQARPRFLTLLLTLFSGVALALAAVGAYGVISYSVAQRTNEFGIRMAIGAQPADVLRMMLGQGMGMGFVGVVIGAIGAATLSRFVGGLFTGVERFDIATFLGMSLTLLAVTLAACYFPARRATKVDPLIALRYE